MTNDELRDRRNAVLAHHFWLNGQMPRLDAAAWQAARALSSSETVDMMRGLKDFQEGLRRHCKFAAVLVYPFVGEARAAPLIRRHLDDQTVVAAAAASACERARGPLAVDLDRVVTRMRTFLDEERSFIERHRN